MSDELSVNQKYFMLPRNCDKHTKGSTVHVKLSHAETSSPKGFKIMLGFEARKLKVKPFIPDYASIDR